MEIIDTKEEVEYAGFWLRFVAHLVDYFVLQIAISIIAMPFLFGMITAIISAAKEVEDETQAIAIIGIILGYVGLLSTLSIIAGWLYYALMESSKQQGTLGKMALGIKVTDIEGNRISFGRATGRYFGKIISTMTIYIGYIMAGFTARKQALHDIMSDCLVVRKNN